MKKLWKMSCLFLMIEKRNIFQIIGFCDFYHYFIEFVFDNFPESVTAPGLLYLKPSKKLP